MKEDEQRLIAALRDLTDEQTRNREAELERKAEERIEQERAEENQKQSFWSNGSRTRKTSSRQSR